MTFRPYFINKQLEAKRKEGFFAQGKWPQVDLGLSAIVLRTVHSNFLAILVKSDIGFQIEVTRIIVNQKCVLL